VLLSAGAYTGGVNEFPAGSTVCVAADATLSPPYVNNAAGSLLNRARSPSRRWQ
jgi:hypothetical protein